MGACPGELMCFCIIVYMKSCILGNGFSCCRMRCLILIMVCLSMLPGEFLLVWVGTSFATCDLCYHNRLVTTTLCKWIQSLVSVMKTIWNISASLVASLPWPFTTRDSLMVSYFSWTPAFKCSDCFCFFLKTYFHLLHPPPASLPPPFSSHLLPFPSISLLSSLSLSLTSVSYSITIPLTLSFLLL